jgi:hypothetical protein
LAGHVWHSAPSSTFFASSSALSLSASISSFVFFFLGAMLLNVAHPLAAHAYRSERRPKLPKGPKGKKQNETKNMFKTN